MVLGAGTEELTRTITKIIERFDGIKEDSRRLNSQAWMAASFTEIETKG